MPYNTTAIPPRKEVTGQTQLPLTRVKKIIGVDPDITICSNNAAFVITLATEMFIQHLATEAQNMAKLERKPRRNIQYKDLANAVAHADNLEFLEDIVPKTATFKAVKAQAAAQRAKVLSQSGPSTLDGTAVAVLTAKKQQRQQQQQHHHHDELPNGSSSTSSGKKHKSMSATPGVATIAHTNGAGAGGGMMNGMDALSTVASRVLSSSEEDPNAQLEMEMRQAQSQQNGDADVDMTG